MSEPKTSLRVSFGYDSHRIRKDRPLILGGLRLQEEGGLLGHSDADVICHAVIDALLSASGLGDIGRMFPDDDERYAGANSLLLLEEAARAAARKGIRVVNCDCTLLAERPKIGRFAGEMAEKMGKAMGLSANAVTVKGKTNEGMGLIGSGEAMAAFAVMLVEISG